MHRLKEFYSFDICSLFLRLLSCLLEFMSEKNRCLVHKKKTHVFVKPSPGTYPCSNNNYVRRHLGMYKIFFII